VVECLLSKCKALSSNPIISRRKKFFIPENYFSEPLSRFLRSITTHNISLCIYSLNFCLCAWGEVFWALNENNFKPRVLYPEKLSLKIDGAIKVFHGK
jgi:hypothetical protein